MKFDIILSGVGGQGGLSVSTLITQAAIEEGLYVKQSEVHGMSQRGGEVLAHLRISDSPIFSPLIPKGTADLILSFEPLEGLRYVAWLQRDGFFITSSTPVKNIESYPDLEQILTKIRSLPNATVIDAEAKAREAGNVRALNMVLLGAASKILPIKKELIEQSIKNYFERKGSSIVESNIKAFTYGL